MIKCFSGWAVETLNRLNFFQKTFTKAAMKEAYCDEVAPIDFKNGDQFADKLKELSLGVKTKLVEKLSVVDDWFLAA